MPAEMTPRERVRTAMSRQMPDRVPKNCDFTPAAYDKYLAHVGAEMGLDPSVPEQAAKIPGPAEYFHMETRGVGFVGPTEMPDFRPWFCEDLPDNTGFSEYGTAFVPGQFYHFARYRFPLETAASLADFDGFPWPDFTPAYRHEHLEADTARLQADGWYVLGGVGHIFENAWQVRGQEQLFEDMIFRPEMAAAIYDRMTEDRAFQARRCCEAGCDCLVCGDDVGMQDRMMMSPAMWRQWLKPRWQYVWEVAKRTNPDVQLWYHSDGAVQPIIPDLIEIGLQILNPVQPECMDQAEIKRLYGDKLAFWGCVGTQTTMPFGTPDEVRANVKWLIDTLGPDGGLLLAPTHVLEPDVPFENVLAFFAALDDFGKY
jgi:uroporphyrinogen decarboxylase